MSAVRLADVLERLVDEMRAGRVSVACAWCEAELSWSNAALAVHRRRCRRDSARAEMLQ